MQESTCLHYFHTTFLLWSVLNGLLGDQDDWFGEFGVLSSWFWLGPFREPESQIQRQRGDHQLAMYYRYLQLEGAKKIRRLYSAILWVWMGCPIFTKCLDNHWIPESSLGPTDKRVDRGGECHISEPEKTICVEAFRNLFWVPSHVPSSLSDSYPWSIHPSMAFLVLLYSKITALLFGEYLLAWNRMQFFLWFILHNCHQSLKIKSLLK